MRGVLSALLAVAVTSLALTKISAQDVPCGSSLIDYTKTVPSLSIFTTFAKVYAASGFNPDPSKGFTVFAPNDQAWLRIFQAVGTKIGGSGSSAFADSPSGVDSAAAPASIGMTTRQADILASVGLYHYTLDNLGSPAKYLAAGNVQSALGDLTGFNVSLYFEEINKKVVVEGIPKGNTAVLTKSPVMVCTTPVYEIDTVLLPSNRIADVPPFTDVINAQGPAGGPVGDQATFDLPLAPDAEAISVTTTGEADGKRSGSSINGNKGNAEGPGAAAVATTEVASQAAYLTTRLAGRWRACAATAVVALTLPALL